MTKLRWLMLALATFAGAFVCYCGSLAFHNGFAVLGVSLAIIGCLTPILSVNDLI